MTRVHKSRKHEVRKTVRKSTLAIALVVGLGFSMGDDTGMTYDDMKTKVMGELKKVFRPELLNRIDEVIVFHKLTKEEILTIVDIQMKRVREQMATHDVAIELKKGAILLKIDEKKHQISEDERKRLETDVQKLTDDTIKEIDAAADAKEKEILGK